MNSFWIKYHRIPFDSFRPQMMTALFIVLWPAADWRQRSRRRWLHRGRSDIAAADWSRLSKRGTGWRHPNPEPRPDPWLPSRSVPFPSPPPPPLYHEPLPHPRLPSQSPFSSPFPLPPIGVSFILISPLHVCLILPIRHLYRLLVNYHFLYLSWLMNVMRKSDHLDTSPCLVLSNCCVWLAHVVAYNR